MTCRQVLMIALDALEMSSAVHDVNGGVNAPLWQERRAEAIERVRQELERLEAEELEEHRKAIPNWGAFS